MDMKTVAQLQAAGFVVKPATDAVGCTEVLSDQPFWFYNEGFHVGMASVQGNMEAAHMHGDRYRLLVAGAFAVESEFPFALVDAGTKSQLDQAYAAYQQMQEGAKTWAQQYMATLNGTTTAGAPA
jgi:hypothetical protein